MYLTAKVYIYHIIAFVYTLFLFFSLRLASFLFFSSAIDQCRNIIPPFPLRSPFSQPARRSYKDGEDGQGLDFRFGFWVWNHLHLPLPLHLHCHVNVTHACMQLSYRTS